MRGSFRDVGVPIRQRPAQAVLLVGEQHHAHGPSGTQAQPLHQSRGLPRHDAADAVVGRPTGRVPRVEVAADEHHLPRALPARDLADDVGGFRIGLHRRSHAQTQRHGHLARDESREALRIFDGNGRRGNLRRALQVDHAARMRRAQAHGADRAHQGSQGPVPRRVDGAVGPVADRLAVCGEGHVEQDDRAGDLACARGQFVEAAHDQQRRGDARLGGTDTAAEAQHHERRRHRFHDVEGLGTSHPAWCHRLLQADVVEAVPPHRLGRPVAGKFQIAGAGQPAAERVAEFRQPIPCRRRAQAGVDQPLQVGPVLSQPFGGRLRFVRSRSMGERALPRRLQRQRRQTATSRHRRDYLRCPRYREALRLKETAASARGRPLRSAADLVLAVDGQARDALHRAIRPGDGEVDRAGRRAEADMQPVVGRGQIAPTGPHAAHDAAADPEARSEQMRQSPGDCGRAAPGAAEANGPHRV